MRHSVSMTCIVGLTLVSFGCASVVPLGGDRYLRTEATQDPVMFGVSNSDSIAWDCKGTQREGYNYEKLDFSDCKQVGDVKHGTAPGYGTAVIMGFFNALTFGLLAAFWGGGGDASASASSNSSAAASSSVLIKGGHK